LLFNNRNIELKTLIDCLLENGLERKVIYYAHEYSQSDDSDDQSAQSGMEDQIEEPEYSNEKTLMK
jgi:hypothetical protein